jgi:hypothetical protein
MRARSGNRLNKTLPSALAAGALLLASAGARADGGALCVSRSDGPFVVSIFTAPTPLRVGSIDVSVLVQNADDRAPVLDAAVDLALRGADLQLTAPATHAAAANKLLYAAGIAIPSPGRWSISAQARAADRVGTASCEIEVGPPAPPAVVFWPYLALPFVVIALFVLQQWLKATR